MSAAKPGNLDAVLEAIRALWDEDGAEIDKLRFAWAEEFSRLTEAYNRMIVAESRANRLREQMAPLPALGTQADWDDRTEDAARIRAEYRALKDEAEAEDQKAAEGRAVLEEAGVRGPDWSHSFDRVTDRYRHDPSEVKRIQVRMSEERGRLLDALEASFKGAGGDESVKPSPTLDPDRFEVITTGSHEDPERIRREEGERQRERFERVLERGYESDPFPEDRLVE
jgi:hypothetical protein